MCTSTSELSRRRTSSASLCNTASAENRTGVGGGERDRALAGVRANGEERREGADDENDEAGWLSPNLDGLKTA